MPCLRNVNFILPLKIYNRTELTDIREPGFIFNERGKSRTERDDRREVVIFPPVCWFF